MSTSALAMRAMLRPITRDDSTSAFVAVGTAQRVDQAQGDHLAAGEERLGGVGRRQAQGAPDLGCELQRQARLLGRLDGAEAATLEQSGIHHQEREAVLQGGGLDGLVADPGTGEERDDLCPLDAGAPIAPTLAARNVAEQPLPGPARNLVPGRVDVLGDLGNRHQALPALGLGRRGEQLQGPLQGRRRGQGHPAEASEGERPGPPAGASLSLGSRASRPSGLAQRLPRQTGRAVAPARRRPRWREYRHQMSWPLEVVR